MSRLRITLRRSPIGYPRDQKDTATVLGLTRLQKTVVRPDTPSVRGMVNKIIHLIAVEELGQDDE